MGVHVNSVIDTWISDYYPEFYNTLTSQEEYAYNSNSGADEAFWIAQFTNLMTEINDWKNASRDLEDWFIQFYTFITVTAQFPDLSFSVPYDPATADAFYIFNMNDFPEDCIARPVSYYDDKTETGVGTGIYYSPKIDADIAQIQAYATQENTRRTTLSDAAATNAKKVVSASLFENPTVVAKSKQEFAELIFVTLNWQTFNDLLNLQLPVPDYITNPE